MHLRTIEKEAHVEMGGNGQLVPDRVPVSWAKASALASQNCLMGSGQDLASPPAALHPYAIRATLNTCPVLAAGYSPD